MLDMINMNFLQGAYRYVISQLVLIVVKASIFVVVVPNITMSISPIINAKSVLTLLSVCPVQVLIHRPALNVVLVISCLLILLTPSASLAQVFASLAVLLPYAPSPLLLDILFRLLVD